MLQECPKCKKLKQLLKRQSLCLDCFEAIAGKGAKIIRPCLEMALERVGETIRPHGIKEIEKMKANFKEELTIECELTKFEDEEEVFIVFRNKTGIAFSAWLKKSEISENWDLIARNLTQTVKNNLYAKLREFSA